jgi:hypothetical protein
MDWNPINEDQRFILYKQKEPVYKSNHIVRRVRTDILKAHPLLCFKAHSTIPTTVSILLNKKIVKEKISLSKNWKEYRVKLPKTDMGEIKGEEIAIDLKPSLPQSHSWEIKDIDFLAFD